MPQHHRLRTKTADEPSGLRAQEMNEACGERKGYVGRRRQPRRAGKHRGAFEDESLSGQHILNEGMSSHRQEEDSGFM